MVFVKATISGGPPPPADDDIVGAPAPGPPVPVPPPDEGYSRERAKQLSWVAGWSYADLQTFIDKLSEPLLVLIL
jgi:hypothetical protein